MNRFWNVVWIGWYGEVVYCVDWMFFFDLSIYVFVEFGVVICGDGGVVRVDMVEW